MITEEIVGIVVTLNSNVRMKMLKVHSLAMVNLLIPGIIKMALAITIDKLRITQTIRLGTKKNRGVRMNIKKPSVSKITTTKIDVKSTSSIPTTVTMTKIIKVDIIITTVHLARTNNHLTNSFIKQIETSLIFNRDTMVNDLEVVEML
jgi:hypothetical protein